MNKILNNYSRMYFVNLLSDSKRSEQKLTNFLKQLLEKLNTNLAQKTELKNIDFHAIVKETDFSFINNQVTNIVEAKDFSV